MAPDDTGDPPTTASTSRSEVVLPSRPAKLDLSGSGCDTVAMKNITVSIDEELHRRARIRAAELDTSLSAVVRDFLTEFAGGETDFERRKRLQDQTLASIGSFRADDRMSRDDAHRRDALR